MTDSAGVSTLIGNHSARIGTANKPEPKPLTPEPKLRRKILLRQRNTPNEPLLSYNAENGFSVTSIVFIMITGKTTELSMRVTLVVLLALFLALQYRLWFGKIAYRIIGGCSKKSAIRKIRMKIWKDVINSFTQILKICAKGKMRWRSVPVTN